MYTKTLKICSQIASRVADLCLALHCIGRTRVDNNKSMGVKTECICYLYTRI